MLLGVVAGDSCGVAAEAGAAVPLDAVVFAAACSLAAAGLESSAAGLGLAVSLSSLDEMPSADAIVFDSRRIASPVYVKGEGGWV